MTREQAYAEAVKSLDDLAAESVGNCRDMLARHGATNAEIETAVAWWSAECERTKNERLAELCGWMARRGEPLH